MENLLELVWNMSIIERLDGRHIDHSVLQGISPTLKYSPVDLTPFYLGPPPKKKIINLSDPFPPPPFMTNPPQSFGEVDSPLEIYTCLKKQTHFFKK